MAAPAPAPAGTAARGRARSHLLARLARAEAGGGLGAAPLFDALSERFALPIAELVDEDGLLLTCVVLGFSRCGRHLISHTPRASPASDGVGGHSLQLWALPACSPGRCRRLWTAPLFCSRGAAAWGAEEGDEFAPPRALRLAVHEPPGGGLLAIVGALDAEEGSDGDGGDDAEPSTVFVSVLPGPEAPHASSLVAAHFHFAAPRWIGPELAARPLALPDNVLALAIFDGERLAIVRAAPGARADGDWLPPAAALAFRGDAPPETAAAATLRWVRTLAGAGGGAPPAGGGGEAAVSVAFPLFRGGAEALLRDCVLGRGVPRAAVLDYAAAPVAAAAGAAPAAPPALGAAPAAAAVLIVLLDAAHPAVRGGRAPPITTVAWQVDAVTGAPETLSARQRADEVGAVPAARARRMRRLPATLARRVGAEVAALPDWARPPAPPGALPTTLTNASVLAAGRSAARLVHPLLPLALAGFPRRPGASESDEDEDESEEEEQSD
jgi:hypothetical protein